MACPATDTDGVPEPVPGGPPDAPPHRRRLSDTGTSVLLVRARRGGVLRRVPVVPHAHVPHGGVQARLPVVRVRDVRRVPTQAPGPARSVPRVTHPFGPPGTLFSLGGTLLRRNTKGDSRPKGFSRRTPAPLVDV